MRVTVIGAGILGSALGYRLARTGVDTTIVDRARQPTGASWTSFAWLNANGKQPESYSELNRAGIKAHSGLADELGDGSWLHLDGSIELAPRGPAADELRARAERQRAHAYPSRPVDAAHLQLLEPQILVDAERVGLAVLFQDEGWLDCEGLIGILRKEAVAAGAHLRLGSPVTAVEQGAVETADGERWVADVTVNAAGASAGDISAMADASLPSTSGTLGLTCVTDRVEGGLQHVVRWPGGTARPHPGGGVMVASTAMVDKRLAELRDPQADANLGADAVRLAAEYLPALADVGVTSTRVARRAVPPDQMPATGFDPKRPWLYHFVTHSGVTLAALLSQRVAMEIVNGRGDPRLDEYRPARFAA